MTLDGTLEAVFAWKVYRRVFVMGRFVIRNTRLFTNYPTTARAKPQTAMI
jgi:hypothetical protein